MRTSLVALEGVNEVVVDLYDRSAVIIYDPNKVDTETMTAATSKVGFPSAIRTKPEE